MHIWCRACNRVTDEGADGSKHPGCELDIIHHTLVGISMGWELTKLSCARNASNCSRDKMSAGFILDQLKVTFSRNEASWRLQGVHQIDTNQKLPVIILRKNVAAQLQGGRPLQASGYVSGKAYDYSVYDHYSHVLNTIIIWQQGTPGH